MPAIASTVQQVVLSDGSEQGLSQNNVAKSHVFCSQATRVDHVLREGWPNHDQVSNPLRHRLLQLGDAYGASWPS